MDALKDAKEELRQAYQNFEYAEPNYIDIAIMQINVAERKYAALLREARV